MAIFNIVEFGVIQAYPDNSSAQIPLTPPVATYELTPTGSSQMVATAVNVNTQMVRISTDTTCRIAFGIGTAAATANATSLRISADAVEYFGVNPGQRIAVILGT